MDETPPGAASLTRSPRLPSAGRPGLLRPNGPPRPPSSAAQPTGPSRLPPTGSSRSLMPGPWFRLA
eukprot:12345878-Alexandrium_andersonii.AAC.1